MNTLSVSRLSAASPLLPLALANGVAVSTLYWGQAVVSRAVGEFGPSVMVSLMPGATLLGYAAGVAALAALAGDLTEPRRMAQHFLLLVLSLGIAAAAPAPWVLTAACVGIGVGCALTQRLLICATTAVPSARRPQTIGWIIAAGLGGIVIARACVPTASALLGWRTVFWLDAGLAGLAGIAATAAAVPICRRSRQANAAPPAQALRLWRQEPTLRLAALQQALVFAAFNMGWAIFPRVVPDGPWSSLSTGCVALLGAGAALLSGRSCARWGAGRVARAGSGAVAVAVVALGVGHALPVCCYAAMLLLDAGTQVALVANQARAQALASTPAMRGRLAAIVTTIGFGGGAAGAALGNLVLGRF